MPGFVLFTNSSPDIGFAEVVLNLELIGLVIIFVAIALVVIWSQ